MKLFLVQHSRSGNTAVRVQELEFSLEFPGGTRPRFKHIMEEMRNNFPDREHVGYKLYTLMKKELVGQIQNRVLCGCFDPKCGYKLRFAVFLDDEPMRLRLKTAEHQREETACASTLALVKAAIDNAYEDIDRLP